MVHTTSISARGLCRALILPLSLALIAAGLSNSPSCAEDGLVYPDSAGVQFSRTIHADTVTVLIQNQTPDAVTNLFIAEFTDAPIAALDCQVDGAQAPDSVIERSFGDIYPGKHTTRWLLGAFTQNVRLKYYSPIYTSIELTWCAGHQFAVFGMMPLMSGIGPPRNVNWGE